MKNILIVDSDVGFIFWLGAALSDAGYQPWPACNSSDAISVAGRKALARLDMLIVNASLPGVTKLIAHFHQTQLHLKVMALGPQDEGLNGVDAWHPAPRFSDDSAKREWVRAVKNMCGRQNRAA
jgi:DNA-binding NtrC family response regulator